MTSIATRRRFIAGIDPGKSTGVGVYDRDESRIVFITTTDFWGVADWLMRYVRIAELKCFVEIPKAFMYDRNHMKEDKIRDNVMLKIGGVRREAQLLSQYLAREGFLVEEVEPIREKKWDAQQFQMYTKCRRQTNEHERDAARIALVYANKR